MPEKRCSKLGFAGLVITMSVALFSNGAHARSIIYTYDESDRLRQIDYPDGKSIGYTYDNTDNRLTQTISYVPPSPVTGVTLSVSPPSPQPYNTLVTFSGAASGGSGSYEYQFLGRLSGSPDWAVAQAYGPTPFWNWTAVSGTYEIQVNARSVWSPAASEASSVTTYTVTAPPVTGVTLSADPGGPRPAGTSVTFTGSAQGGSGYYEYQFLGRQAGSPTWSIAQAYWSNPSWTWTAAGGTWEIKVDARNFGSTESPAESQTITYSVTTAAVTGVTLSASPSSPQSAGTQVTFTGSASGGTGSYEYEFRGRQAGQGEFSVAQAYGVSPSWTWTVAAGTWEIQVNARSAGSTAAAEASQTITYVVQ